jgi:hypothetical protein
MTTPNTKRQTSNTKQQTANSKHRNYPEVSGADHMFDLGTSATI